MKTVRKQRIPRQPTMHIVLAPVVSDSAQLRWVVVTAGLKTIGEPDEGADEVLQRFKHLTNRDDGLRDNDRLERISEPVSESELVNIITRLKRKQLKG